jgi:S-adenosylmethionine-diacylglycerol 3-amino-3-carboxypropyl transferase
MKTLRPLVNTTHDLLFKAVHSRCLIYNTCWEDPKIDRQLLGLGPGSKLVALTSAGCNTLDYLLDSPAEIHAVDVNPRQNALLHLKLALIEHGQFDELFAMFGAGIHCACRELYGTLRSRLPSYAAAFWDDKIRYFDGAGMRKSFYYYGTTGTIAWLVKQYLTRAKRKMSHYLLALLNAQQLEEQQEIYRLIEPNFWKGLSVWLVSQPAVLALLGVPRPQMRLIQKQYPTGVAGYVREKLEHVLTEVPMRDNYFWRVYLTGSYTQMCCPNYLKSEHLPLLQANAHTVATHNLTLNEFLQRHPGTYTHFVLLDHQDWLAWHNPAALQEEWRLLLKHSRPGTKLLLRSAGADLGFLPEEAGAALRFFPALTQELHRRDRVGTYGSVHLAEVA